MKATQIKTSEIQKMNSNDSSPLCGVGVAWFEGVPDSMDCIVEGLKQGQKPQMGMDSGRERPSSDCT